MVIIDNPDFQEFYFLSSCYNEGFSETKVYTAFIQRVLVDFTFPKTITVNELQKEILSNYLVEIPPTLIKDIFKDIARTTGTVKIKSDKITISSLPEYIKELSESQIANLKSDTKIIRTEFDSQLLKAGLTKATDAEFKSAFNSYCNMIINKNHEQSPFFSVLSDWIHSVYRYKTNKVLVKAMDKLIYSWLLFTYYYSVKRQKRQLQGFQIALDTNMLAYLLDINGKERKMYVEYLLGKMRINNCTLVINDFTISELVNLISNTDIPAIQIFRNENPAVVQQIRLNADEYFTQLFRDYGLKVIINRKVSPINTESKYYKDLSSNLKQYKTLRRPYITDHSLNHDIKLVHCFGALHKISNVYSEKKIIGTCDNTLCKWLSGYIKREFDSNYSNLLSLEMLSLIFWIETDKANTSSFLSDTWMYLTDSISFFKKIKLSISRDNKLE